MDINLTQQLLLEAGGEHFSPGTVKRDGIRSKKRLGTGKKNLLTRYQDLWRNLLLLIRYYVLF